MGVQRPQRFVPQQDRPIGWYRDPAQPSGHRYWDGKAWLPAADGVGYSPHDCTTYGPVDRA
jgi:hypothetical protein